ncbi:MAG: hypothetical protein WB994_19960 [Candidatus Acidiferrum sp.]
MPKKPDIFKMLDVKRKRLLAVPGNALKIWLYYWMREGKERLAWASEEDICDHTRLNRDTMRKWRNWLLEYGWLHLMGHRNPETGNFSVAVFRVDEGIAGDRERNPGSYSKENR